jgi:hypothetical protein
VLLISDPSDLMLSAVPVSRLGVGSADGKAEYGKPDDVSSGIPDKRRKNNPVSGKWYCFG